MRCGTRINVQMRGILKSGKQERKAKQRKGMERNLERAARVVLIHEVHVLRRVDADPNKSHCIIVVEILHLNADKATERGIRGNPSSGGANQTKQVATSNRNRKQERGVPNEEERGQRVSSGRAYLLDLE